MMNKAALAIFRDTISLIQGEKMRMRILEETRSALMFKWRKQCKLRIGKPYILRTTNAVPALAPLPPQKI